MPSRIVQAPPDSGELVLGRTLPELLDEAVARNPNPAAFHQLRDGAWRSISTAELRDQAEELALGLHGLGVESGQPVTLFARSDLTFIVPDMATLLLGAVSVPIHLTHSPAAVRHILEETCTRVLIVSDAEIWERIAPQLPGTTVETVILMEAGADGPAAGTAGDRLVVTATELSERGRAARDRDPELPGRLLRRRAAKDLATIIYTSGTTGTPKGVMLSHENMSSNAIAAFTGLKGFRRGAEEVVLSFLPLSHIFARTLQYGLMWYGNTVYYTEPDRVGEHLREVRPTLFATVPRVVERAYERIIAAGGELTGVRKALFDWAVALVRRYRTGLRPTGLYALQLRVADALVLSKWRAALGGRVNYIIVGGAALRGELVDLFGGAGIEVLQGYGLTESSPIISFNRPGRNRAGTVGEALAGVEIRVAEDGEILTRGPHVMLGYYQREDATAETIEDGWLHTGDLGSLDGDGYLSITGRSKNLFKLSTGKYVMPQPLEQQLEADPLVAYTLVVGDGRKYCGAMLFLDPEALAAHAGGRDGGAALADPGVQARLAEVLREANRGLPSWSTVKRAVLLSADGISTENGLLTPTLKLRREHVLERYSQAFEALYAPAGRAPGVVVMDVEGAAAQAPVA